MHLGQPPPSTRFPRSTSARAALLAGCASLALAGCHGNDPPPRARPTSWEVGYWYWRTSPGVPPATSAAVPDVLYVQVGEMTPASLRGARWPSDLPEARSYVATWRANEPEAPPSASIAPLVAAYRTVRSEVAARGGRLAGLQLDVDCPTGSLGAYGDFLKRLRAELGTGERLSVTALLDWFRPGTRVGHVVANVDEYVPQFYDARLGGPHASIGERLDHDTWAPVFDALGCPYRLGLSTFGRVQRVRTVGDGGVVRDAFRDLTLLQLAASGFRPTAVEETKAGERLLRFDVARELPPALRAGDRVEAIVPTREGIRAAYAEARKFGGLCAGVVFFRWPAQRETLTLRPDEVAEAIGSSNVASRDRLEASDGGCQPRSCTDLRVHLRDRFPVEPVRLRVKASADVEYLVPAQAGVTMRQTARREIAIEIPPFLGEGDLLIGRAVSKGRPTYRLADETP